MTLDEFIRSRIDGKTWPRNACVSEAGFSSLYVRVTQRYVEGQLRKPVLDLASAEAELPGQGAFTALVARLRKDWPALGLFAECVLNERFREKLTAMGFRCIGPGPCYWMPPVGEETSSAPNKEV